MDTITCKTLGFSKSQKAKRKKANKNFKIMLHSIQRIWVSNLGKKNSNGSAQINIHELRASKSLKTRVHTNPKIIYYIKIK